MLTTYNTKFIILVKEPAQLNIFSFSNLTGTSKVSVSDNVKLLSWLPQNDILGHPKTRLFIGHAGLNGILESTYHGVPMICSPFFGDQFDNARIAKHAGFGEVVDLDTTSADEFVSLIRKVLTQPRWAYNNNIDIWCGPNLSKIGPANVPPPLNCRDKKSPTSTSPLFPIRI